MPNPLGSFRHGAADAPEPDDTEDGVVHVLAEVLVDPPSAHRPERRSRSASDARRAAPSISMNAVSAVVSSSTPGVLQTTTPWAAAAAMSTLS